MIGQSGDPLLRDTHRWDRATITDIRYGPSCECGNPKTDQALTCNDCAIERRRASDYWERRTCSCGAPKMRRAAMCRPCRNETMRGVTTIGSPQPQSHPWRKAETLRLAS
jgi:hypothetical protein